MSELAAADPFLGRALGELLAAAPDYIRLRDAYEHGGGADGSISTLIREALKLQGLGDTINLNYARVAVDAPVARCRFAGSQLITSSETLTQRWSAFYADHLLEGAHQEAQTWSAVYGVTYRQYSDEQDGETTPYPMNPLAVRDIRDPRKLSVIDCYIHRWQEEDRWYVNIHRWSDGVGSEVVIDRWVTGPNKRGEDPRDYDPLTVDEPTPESAGNTVATGLDRYQFVRWVTGAGIYGTSLLEPALGPQSGINVSVNSVHQGVDGAGSGQKYIIYKGGEQGTNPEPDYGLQDTATTPQGGAPVSPVANQRLGALTVMELRGPSGTQAGEWSAFQPGPIDAHLDRMVQAMAELCHLPITDFTGGNGGGAQSGVAKNFDHARLRDWVRAMQRSFAAAAADEVLLWAALEEPDATLAAADVQSSFEPLSDLPDEATAASWAQMKAAGVSHRTRVLQCWGWTAEQYDAEWPAGFDDTDAEEVVRRAPVFKVLTDAGLDPIYARDAARLPALPSFRYRALTDPDVTTDERLDLENTTLAGILTQLEALNQGRVRVVAVGNQTPVPGTATA